MKRLSTPRPLQSLVLCLLLLMPAGAVQAAEERPHITFPKYALAPQELAIIINDADPLSRQIGGYYRQVRNLPEQNLIHIRFEAGRPQLNPEAFTALRQQILAATPAHIQAYALTWALPYRVGCMSITSAITFGYDEAYCAQGCKLTKPSPYFNSSSRLPFTQLGMRPSMAIAATDFGQAKRLIDRGVAADHRHPQGTGYLLSTSDRARNTRARLFPYILKRLQELYPLQQVDADFIAGKEDILFYFTGMVRVPALETNRFLPGAIADHLTSAGGRLDGTNQMTSLRWLEAGATGSYGTVVEPCNFIQKFPHPGIVMARYLGGESLIEAYWKSVEQPGQGLFIGDPLANPFGGIAYKWEGQDLLIHTRTLTPGNYLLLSAGQPQGPFQAERRFTVEQPGLQTLRLEQLEQPLYQIVPVILAPADKPAVDQDAPDTPDTPE